MFLNIDKAESFYLHNGKICSTKDTNIKIPSEVKLFYEVIRVIDSTPLFLNEHLDRLGMSLALSGLPAISISDLKKGIDKLLKENPVKQKNIKINHFNHSGECNTFVYFVESHYPGSEAYTNGVKVELLPMQRNTPNVKLENPVLRGSADKAICLSQTHEVLLVNEQGFITEGSRSNFFAIIGGKLTTPPAAEVLEGITRKMVINLALGNGIELIERPIHSTEICGMEGAFITGTSSKVLPITRIGEISFQHIHTTVLKLMQLYDQLVQERLHEYHPD